MEAMTRLRWCSRCCPPEVPGLWLPLEPLVVSWTRHVAERSGATQRATSTNCGYKWRTQALTTCLGTNSALATGMSQEGGTVRDILNIIQHIISIHSLLGCLWDAFCNLGWFWVPSINSINHIASIPTVALVMVMALHDFYHPGHPRPWYIYVRTLVIITKNVH